MQNIRAKKKTFSGRAGDRRAYDPSNVVRTEKVSRSQVQSRGYYQPQVRRNVAPEPRGSATKTKFQHRHAWYIMEEYASKGVPT